MEREHIPVLAIEVIDNLKIKPDGVYVDGTLGRAGHSSLIAERLSKHGHLIGIDKDKEAIEISCKILEKFNCKKTFVHAKFSDISEILKENNIDKIDGAILDLGVSSPQLDEKERGFSYMEDGPLDMRMDRSDIFTAKDVINEYDEKRLAEIIKIYGEERYANRIAKLICIEREKKQIETTMELVNIIKKAIPSKSKKDNKHPAKRTFQAIRMEVNDELYHIEKAIDKYIDHLKPGGRFLVISFHSLEDRIVKETFRNRAFPCTCPKDFPVCVCNKKADIRKDTLRLIKPSEEEITQNSRARSAKMRVVEKREEK